MAGLSSKAVVIKPLCSVMFHLILQRIIEIQGRGHRKSVPIVAPKRMEEKKPTAALLGF